MKLQDKLNNYKELPSADLWERIHTNLTEKSIPDKERKMKFTRFSYTNIAKVAALFIGFFAVLFSMKNMFSDHNKNIFASNINAPIKIEELRTSNIEVYFAPEQIENLRKAYTSIIK